MENIQALVGRPTAQDEHRKTRFLSIDLFAKAHPQSLLSVGGMKDSVVHHVLIKSSNICMQKYSENHACRSWRTVTKLWGVDFPSRCYLTRNSKYAGPARGRVLQKQELAPTLAMCTGKEASLVSQVHFHEVLPCFIGWIRERKSNREKKKYSGFHRNVFYLWPYIFFEPASKRSR